MKNFLFIALFCVLIVSLVDAGRPKRQQTACGKYEKEVKNSKGETKCVPKTDSCVGSPDFVNVNCFVSPCSAFKNSCPQATKCYTDACNACKASVYDDQYNKLSCKPASSL